MQNSHENLLAHRVQSRSNLSVVVGQVRYSFIKSIWFLVMAVSAVVGGFFTCSLTAITLFVASTGLVLLVGHSLGSHRKLIHNSYQCPIWMEYLFVYLGTLVGLAGPIGFPRSAHSVQKCC